MPGRSNVDRALAEVLSLVYATVDSDKLVHISVQLKEPTLAALDGLTRVLRKSRSDVFTLGIEALLAEMKRTGTLDELLKERARLDEESLREVTQFLHKRVTQKGLE